MEKLLSHYITSFLYNYK